MARVVVTHQKRKIGVVGRSEQRVQNRTDFPDIGRIEMLVFGEQTLLFQKFNRVKTEFRRRCLLAATARRQQAEKNELYRPMIQTKTPGKALKKRSRVGLPFFTIASICRRDILSQLAGGSVCRWNRRRGRTAAVSAMLLETFSPLARVHGQISRITPSPFSPVQPEVHRPVAGHIGPQVRLSADSSRQRSQRSAASNRTQGNVIVQTVAIW